MEKENLVQAISDVRTAWEATIAELDSDGLEQPGAEGDRRVRDVLAIFNGWDRYNLVQLRCAFTGEIPTSDELTGGIPYPARDTFSVDAMNAMFMAGTRDLPVEDIVRDWREISAMRADWVSAASQTMLDEIVGADWSDQSLRKMRLASDVPSVSNAMPVWQLIFDQVDLQKYHLQTVRDWMDR
ncbi:MAG: hypothetical protein IH586_13730 [Anaerolineaceae bacterium]|nr:hypothetical protein [Anaerolineaceae bacterium]